MRKNRGLNGRKGRRLIAALAAAGLLAVPAARPAATAPLDRVEAYTLEIGPEGPGRGYFPLGLRPGLVHLATHAGFNLLQVSTTHAAFPDQAAPFPPAPDPGRRGHFYYSMGRAAQSVARGPGLPRETAAHGTLPAALDPAGAPWPGLAGINIFDEATRGYLHDFLRQYARRWGSDHPPGQPTLFWGMDSQWEATGFDHGRAGISAFRAWLDEAYKGDIDGLNEAWGTGLPDFAAVTGAIMPGETAFRDRPGLFLDWLTFRTETFTRLQAALARTVHDNDPHRRGVVNKQSTRILEKPAAARRHTFDIALFAELTRPFAGRLLGGHAFGSGDRHTYETSYFYHCRLGPGEAGRPGGPGVMLDGHQDAETAPQWAATYWRALANGLKAANFFCTGWPGATGNPALYAHVEPATGRPRDTMFYAARWAHAIHRTERLWSEAAPAPGVPRLALLLPRHDILLTETDPAESDPGAQARNRRVTVFRRLREQGYWVDVIPVEKLDPAFLAGYQALFLVGAEHLDAGAARAVTDYVAGGGTLVADARPGFFDRHHRERRQLDRLLGLAPGALDPAAETSVEFAGQPLIIRGRVTVKPAGARVAASAADGRPLVLTSRHGRGRVLYFATELGAMSAPAPARPGRWLGQVLAAGGLAPAVRLAPGAEEYAPLLRVEQPLADRRGNLVLVVTTRGRREPETLPPLELELPLPGGPWRRGLWAPAEHMGLAEVTLTPRRGGRHRLRLPGLETAGVLYLLRDHPPLMSIDPPETPGGRAADGHAARVGPGESFALRVRLHNPAAAPLAAGRLRLIAADGWAVSPPVHLTAPWRPGLFRRPETAEFHFTVTPDPEHENIQPDWLYPLVARWSEGGGDRAVCTLNVEAVPDPGRVRRLLSDNRATGRRHGRREWPADYPWRLATGAVYRHLAPDAAHLADPDGSALTAGESHSVGYRADRAEIIFDLGAPYRVDRVQVRGASAGTNLAADTSADGRNWGPPAAFREVSDLWQEEGAARADFPPAPARYVRLEARFPGDRGEIAEVEIWGFPPAPPAPGPEPSTEDR